MELHNIQMKSLTVEEQRYNKHDTSINVGLLCVQRLRRWPHNKPTLDQRLVLGSHLKYLKQSRGR